MHKLKFYGIYDAARFAEAWDRLSLVDRLTAIRSRILGRIVFTTSFGLWASGVQNFKQTV